LDSYPVFDVFQTRILLDGEIAGPAAGRLSQSIAIGVKRIRPNGHQLLAEFGGMPLVRRSR